MRVSASVLLCTGQQAWGTDGGSEGPTCLMQEWSYVSEVCLGLISGLMSLNRPFPKCHSPPVWSSDLLSVAFTLDLPALICIGQR